MSSGNSITITLPPEEAKWLRWAADACNLTPQEIVSLQILAQRHVEDLTIGDASEEESEGRRTVFDALKEAHERLDDLNEKRERSASTTDRMNALRSRLDDIQKRRKTSIGRLNPEKARSAETLIREVLDRMAEVSGDGASSTTSMFEIADEEE